MIASTEFEKNWQGYLWTIEGSNKLCLINLSEMSKGGVTKSTSVCQCFSNSVDAILRNHVIKFWKFMMKSSYLGYLRRKLLFGEILFIYQKIAIFTVDTLNMTIFIIFTIFPMIRCIDSSLKKNYPKNFFFGRKHPIYDTLYILKINQSLGKIN